MTQRKKKKAAERKSYPTEYKAEAVKLSDKLGATEAARQLGIQSSQIYNWRAKLRREESSSEAEQRLMAENAKLKRELAEQKEETEFLKKAAAYFSRHQK